MKQKQIEHKNDVHSGTGAAQETLSHREREKKHMPSNWTHESKYYSVG